MTPKPADSAPAYPEVEGHIGGHWSVYDQAVDDGPGYCCSIGSTLPDADWIAGQIEIREDAALIALAPTAPHRCAVDGCPGNRTRLKLEAAEKLVAWARAFGHDHHGTAFFEGCPGCAALSAWEAANG